MSDNDFEDMPFFDLEAEQVALGAAMLSPNAASAATERLDDQHFVRAAHQTIFGTIATLSGRGEPTDVFAVKGMLQDRGELGVTGGPLYLHSLIEMVPTATNIDFYIERLLDKGDQRGLARMRVSLKDIIASPNLTRDERLDAVWQAIEQATGKTVATPMTTVADLVFPVLDRLEKGTDTSGVTHGWKDLADLIPRFKPGQLITVGARPGMGKALELDTVLPTPDGWTTMGEVQVGDKLMAADGTPTVVLAATDVMVDRPCFEITFEDGTTVVADADHLWLTDTRASRKSAQAAAVGYNRYRNQKTFAEVRTTREIAQTLRCATADQRLNHSVINAKALDLPERDLPLAPYTLGAWLGDGTSRSATITSADPEIPMMIEAEGYRMIHRGGLNYSIKLTRSEFAERICVVCNCTFTPHLSWVRTCGRSCGGQAKQVGSAPSGSTCMDCGQPNHGRPQCMACYRHHGTVGALLRQLGVLQNKHIPDAYLRSSISQRRALLAGLLDTDGTVTKGGAAQFSVTSQALAEDVYELVVSLGYRCFVQTKTVKGRSQASSTAYTLNIATADTLFGLERKKILHKERSKPRPSAGARFITSVRPVPSVPVRCVQVDHPSHLYLATRSMIPTHNSVIMANIAYHVGVELQLPVFFGTLEMSHDELMLRMFARAGKVDLKRLNDPDLLTEDDWDRLRRANKILSTAGTLVVDDEPGMGVAYFRSKLREMRRAGMPASLVVIDYLQLMQSGKGSESRQAEVGQISRSLKLLAKEFQVPVIIGSQLNRMVEQRSTKRPMAADLRESGSIEQDSDIVILLYREDAYEPESPRAGEIDLIVDKNRSGPRGTAALAWQGHYARAADLAHDDTRSPTSSTGGGQ